MIMIIRFIRGLEPKILYFPLCKKKHQLNFEWTRIWPKKCWSFFIHFNGIWRNVGSPLFMIVNGDKDSTARTGSTEMKWLFHCCWWIFALHLVVVVVYLSLLGKTSFSRQMSTNEMQNFKEKQLENISNRSSMKMISENQPNFVWVGSWSQRNSWKIWISFQIHFPKLFADLPIYIETD